MEGDDSVKFTKETFNRTSLTSKKVAAAFTFQTNRYANKPPHQELLPAKVLARHLIKALVMWPVEVPEPPHHLRVNESVCPPFCLPQAVRFAAALGLLQAGEAFCLVKVEMLVRDDPLETQKVLDSAQFPGRIRNEPLTADQMDLSLGEPGQPALQVLGVQTNPQWAPQGVDLTWRHGTVRFQPERSLFLSV